MGLETIDYIVILIYAAALIGIGVLLAKKASGGLDEYFLGGRTLPWYLLGTSGMANWFDLTGTMVITSFLFMIGPRALFIEFRGGVVLILVFILCFTAKWHRRSGCMTGAEWMQFRFGNGKDADAARLLTAIVSILPVIGMIAYLIRGTGQFLSMFVPYAPSVCAVGFALVAVAYTASAGFYGVVVADLLQSTLIIGGAIVLSIMAYNMFTPMEVNGTVLSAADTLKSVAADVTGNTSWTEALPSWHVQMPDDPEYKFFQFLIIAMGFYMVQQAISGLASGSDQKYFAARSDKECGKLNLLVSVLISVRWPMMIGLAVLGISIVNEYFNGENKDLAVYRDVEAVASAHHGIENLNANPALKTEALVKDLQAVLGEEWGMEAIAKNASKVKSVLQSHNAISKSWLELSASANSFNPTLQKYMHEKLGADWAEKIKSTGKMRIVADMIRKAYKDKDISKANWHETTTAIIKGENPELAKKIESLLGDNWKKKLMLVGYHGVTDPERILPAVISAKVSAGWMGVLLVTLLAASMSTFGSTVNSASAYAVKDIYQKLFRPNAGRKELITASWATTILITGIGFFLSLVFDSINDVWDWIIMSVTTGLFVPGFLRMYWWRMNGWGVAFGMASGGIAAITQRILQQNLGWEFAPWDKFAFVAVFAFAATIIGCLMTKPTPMPTLVYFYKKTRPFGFWGPVRKYVTKEQLDYINGENRRDIAALPFAFLYQVTLFMLPMLLVIHQTKMFFCILPVFIISVIALYLLWYKNLRPDRKMELEETPIKVPEEA